MEREMQRLVVLRHAADRDQVVILVGLKDQVIRSFVRLGLLPLIKRCLRFRKRLNALHYSATVASKADEE